MVQYPTAGGGLAGNRGMLDGMTENDWNNEVQPPSGRQTGEWMQPASVWQREPGLSARSRLDMQNAVHDDTVAMPLSAEEAYLGSLKNMLLRNRGNYIVATFLIGTQSTVSFEGVLYEVGNDFITIYQEGRDRYIVADMYSLKYMEFYDTRQERRWPAMLQENGSRQAR